MYTVNRVAQQWQKEAREREEGKEEFALEDLLAAEQELGSRLTSLSKHASQNKPQMDHVMKQMKELDGMIEQAQRQEQAASLEAIRPQQEELQAKQDAIHVEIARMSKQPSRYAAKLQELGKASKEIDEQLEGL